MVAQLDVHPTGDQDFAGPISAGSATFFCRDWSWNNFYGLSLPSACFKNSGERICTLLLIRLENLAYPVKVWLGKLTALDPMGWLGPNLHTLRKSSELRLAEHSWWAGPLLSAYGKRCHLHNNLPFTVTIVDSYFYTTIKFVGTFCLSSARLSIHVCDTDYFYCKVVCPWHSSLLMQVNHLNYF